MRWMKKILNPLFALIGIQLVWVLLVVLWIYWFVGRHKEFRELARVSRPDLLVRGFDWPVLVEGLVLLIIILAGVYVIFLYWRRQSKLYKQQKDLMAQITHELKSPLASIQLHLETISLRKPPPDKLERFIDTMLGDTERLNNLISNLLMAAKLEQRRRPHQHPAVDISAIVTASMERKKAKLPEGGNIALSIEPGIRCNANAEELETVLRNLFENAILYSVGTPEIRVTLERAANRCRITFQDNGRGIEAGELKRVFRMFYRVRQPGENIRGTGLGLFIVKSIVSEHGGTVRVESEGIGKGCRFEIMLPLAQ